MIYEFVFASFTISACVILGFILFDAIRELIEQIKQDIQKKEIDNEFI